MKAMAKHRIHSIEFKRQVALDFIAGETLHGLAKRHDISRNLIRIWVKKLEAGAFDEDARSLPWRARAGLRLAPLWFEAGAVPAPRIKRALCAFGVTAVGAGAI